MRLQKFRWSRIYESTEEELLEFMASKDTTGERLHIDMLEEAAYKTAEAESTIWCAEGSLQVQIAGTTTPMQPGDGAKLPSNTDYTVNAGISGCVFYISTI